MGKMLLAVVITGVAIAGIILYVDSQESFKNPLRGKVKRAARDAYDTMNANIGHVERSSEKLLM